MGKQHSDNIEHIITDARADAVNGHVRWSAEKSLWFLAMLAGWLIGGIIFFSYGAVATFLTTSAVTLCFGHSLGMHRKLIHQSYTCPDWMEKTGVWLGTLVGLGGPFTMMRTHDMRDWAQRQPKCHAFFSHQSAMGKDMWWQIHCKLHLDNTPGFHFPEAMATSRFYRALQATSMLQQVPVAILLWAIGGWGFVFWGICGRVTVSILGHWLIGYIAHNTGHRDWHVANAAVQGHNVRFCGLITFGECWHNNHHAFPGSAKLGLNSNQPDPGWWVLKVFERIGLVSNLVLPAHLPPRQSLRRLNTSQAASSPRLGSPDPTKR